ncbi:MAG TPA: hypothetical protein VMH87_01325 [Pseudomonadales bacterium]|nr:hypothetical protein [Pseudomonadales bacterium]
MRTKTLLIASAGVLAAAITSSQAQTVYSQNVVGYVNSVLTQGQNVLLANPLNGTTNSINAIMPGLQGGELVNVWNGAGYYTYQYQGAGVGTGLGFQSDWTDGNSFPPATPAIPGDQADTVNGVYWAPAPVLNPGQGFFIASPNQSETNTFTGTVVTTNSITLTQGHNFLVASAIPVGGDVTTNPAITLTKNFGGGELMNVWNGSGYYTYQYQGAGVGTGLGFQSDWTDGNAFPPAHPSIPGDQTDTVNGVYWAPSPQLQVGQGFFISSPNATEVWSQSITNIP